MVDPLHSSEIQPNLQQPFLSAPVDGEFGPRSRFPDLSLVESRLHTVTAEVPGFRIARLSFHPREPIVFLAAFVPAALDTQARELITAACAEEFGLKVSFRSVYFTERISPDLLDKIGPILVAHTVPSLLDCNENKLTLITPDAREFIGRNGNGRPHKEFLAALPPDVSLQVVSVNALDIIPEIPSWLIEPRSYLRGENIEIRHHSDPEHDNASQALGEIISKTSPLPVRFVRMAREEWRKRSASPVNLPKRSNLSVSAHTPVVNSEVIRDSIKRLLPDARVTFPDFPQGAIPIARIWQPANACDLLIGHKVCANLPGGVRLQFRYWRAQSSPHKHITRGVTENALRYVRQHLPPWLRDLHCELDGKQIHITFSNVLDETTAQKLHTCGTGVMARAPLPVVLERRISHGAIFRELADELRCSGWDFSLIESKNELHVELNSAGTRDLGELRTRIIERTGCNVFVVARDRLNIPPPLAIDKSASNYLEVARIIQKELPPWIQRARLSFYDGRFVLQHGNDLDREQELQTLQNTLSEQVKTPVQVERQLDEFDLRQIVVEELGNLPHNIAFHHNNRTLEIECDSIEASKAGIIADSIEARSGYYVSISSQNNEKLLEGDRRRILVRAYDCAVVKALLPGNIFVSDVRFCAGKIQLLCHNELSRLPDLRSLAAGLSKHTKHTVECLHSLRDIDLFRIVAAELRLPEWSLGYRHRTQTLVLAHNESASFDREALRSAVDRRSGYKVIFEPRLIQASPVHGRFLGTAASQLELERILAEEIGTSQYRMSPSRARNTVEVTIVGETSRSNREINGALTHRLGCNVLVNREQAVEKSVPRFNLEDDMASLRKLGTHIPRECGKYKLVVQSENQVTVKIRRFLPSDVLRRIGMDLNRLSRFRISIVRDPDI